MYMNSEGASSRHVVSYALPCELGERTWRWEL